MFGTDNTDSSNSVQGTRQLLWRSHCVLCSNELYAISRNISTTVKWGKASRRLMN